MRKLTTASIGLFLGMLALASSLVSADGDGVGKVRAAPGASQDLTMQSGPLRFFFDAEGDNGEGQPQGRGYWYLTYTVINGTAEEQIWAPRFDLFDDDGRILRSGRDVSREVTTAILEKIGDPLMHDQFQVLGTLLPGQEHARSGLVVWVADPLEATELTLFVRGLSREMEQTSNPVTGEKVVLHRALQREYVVPGEPKLRGPEPMHFVAESWIFR
ncbi:MAG: hypothetical protein EXS00_05440 [Phycisphaerales bacterium]|nr:hypothetical protein [Phycisphaerales bacterium]